MRCDAVVATAVCPTISNMKMHIINIHKKSTNNNYDKSFEQQGKGPQVWQEIAFL